MIRTKSLKGRTRFDFPGFVLLDRIVVRFFIPFFILTNRTYNKCTILRLSIKVAVDFFPLYFYFGIKIILFFYYYLAVISPVNATNGIKIRMLAKGFGVKCK